MLPLNDLWAISVHVIYLQVKYWITLNDPWAIAALHYGSPWITYDEYQNSGVDSYLVGHNLLKAHAEVYRMYEEEFKPEQKGVFIFAEQDCIK